MVGAELVRDRRTKEPASQETSHIQREAIKRGLLFPTAGLWGNVIRFLVPLVTPDDALEEGLSILAEAFAAQTA
jgi:4-aminobutyrate aminotransferase/(S)-3-amino-2-methylpropionate transaminase